ncbi:hypothetical protein LCGC14_1262160 [marine sediment metagenome]|uniref:Uncharacterized protein n=1 Tax=marine sediment metagenome TaxID=412755 RepID=A0A0F9LLM9_9ZZZZ
MAKKPKTYEELVEDSKKGKLNVIEAMSFFPEAKACELERRKKR